MQCPNKSEDGINTEIDNILADDKREKVIRKRKCEDRKTCREPEERDSKKKNFTEGCKIKYNGVNESKRFSLRIMEALRAIHRQSGCQTQGASTCDIVDYVRQNFHTDGDIEAQVLTSLKRTCCQGFVKNEGNDTYSLVGPFACQLIKTQNANANKSTPDMTKQTNTKGCRKKSPQCKKNRRGCGKNQTQEISDVDLSIPTSVEEDILRQRIERDIENLESNDDSNDDIKDTTINRNSEQLIRSPRWDKDKNFDGTTVAEQRKCYVKSRHNTPRNRSSDREENEIIGAIRDPAQDFEIGVDLQDFEDDDGNEPLNIPNDRDDESEPPDEDDEYDDDDDDAKSNDSLLKELKCKRENKTHDENKDRELRRWIRNCRRECARRAAMRK